MQLCDEYLQRHGLEIKRSHHVDRGVVFLRKCTKSAIHWSMIFINYKHHKVRPGEYTVQYTRPVRRGYHGRSYEVVNEDILQWDQYEDGIISFLNNQIGGGYKLVKGQENVVLTAWEIFVHTQDGFLVSHINDEDFLRSLDLDLSSTERHKSYLSFTNKNKRQEWFIYWSDEWINHIRHYCHWLVDIKN